MECARIHRALPKALEVSMLAITLAAAACGGSGEKTPPERRPTPERPTPEVEVEEVEVPAPTAVDIESSKVPHDLEVEGKASQTQLAQFAWQEFVALNWPASYKPTAPRRGAPDDSPGVTFASVTSKTTTPLVWQTYKHRVEVFPMDTSGYDKSFDSAAVYAYTGTPEGDVYPCSPTGVDPSGTPLSQLNLAHDRPNVFNNLDETTEINLCSMYVDADPAAPAPLAPYMVDPEGRRFIYEAKANRQMFDYVAANSYFEFLTRWKAAQRTHIAVSLDHVGGVAPCPDASPGNSLICFPPGVRGHDEGSIEIKATWRQLTKVEVDSGRFLVAPVIRYFNYEEGNQDAICYDMVESSPTAHSLPYGLVGLHIIHKTTKYPTYVFATFEQVDNLDQGKPNNTLFYFNRNSGIVNPGKQVITSRAHPVQQATEDVNSQVHAQIVAKNASSVWQYYKLVGVQGPAADFSNDNDFFLANIVTETNEPLRSFSGSLDSDKGTINPQNINVHKGNETLIGGGCKGCHGNAQAGVPPPNNAPPPIKARGKGSFDFSFITANAPFDGVPDAANQPLLKNEAAWYQGPQVIEAGH